MTKKLLAGIIVLQMLFACMSLAGISTRDIVNIGSPTDDPSLLEPGTLYIPDPLVHPPPWPTVVGTRAGGFTDGGLANLVQPFTDLANAGYLCLAFECRLAKSSGGNGGLCNTPAFPAPGPCDPKYGGGQTSSGHYHQQTDDMKRAIRAMRSNPFNLNYQVTGFVAGLGGSGSAHHVVYCVIDGTPGDDKLDAGMAMSPPTDFSGITESDASSGFVSKVKLYADCVPTGDLPCLLSKSPIALPLATMNPLWRANGDAENMPLSQKTRMDTAIGNANPPSNQVTVLNTGDCGGLQTGCGSVHAFGIWDFRGPEETTWLNARVAEWTGGGGGTPTPTPSPSPVQYARIILGQRQPPPVTRLYAQGIIGGGSSSWTSSVTNGRFKKYFFKDIQPAGKTITGVASTDVITSTSHGYSNGDQVELVSVTGGAGLSAVSNYYVRDVTTNTFKLATVSGGTAVNFTTDISAGVIAKFSWTDIDSQITSAVSNNKQFVLLLNLNSADPTDGLAGLPTWLTDAGAIAYGITDPNHGTLLYQFLSWDPVFQTYSLKLIEALCDHIDGKAVQISMGGLGKTTEMGDIPIPSPDGKSDADAAAAWVSAVNTYVAQYSAHLTKTTFTFAMQIPFSGQLGIDSLNTVINSALLLYENRPGFENWSLNARSSTNFLPIQIISDHASTNPPSFQMIGNATTGGGGNLNGTLRECLDVGVGLNARAIQVFGDDIDNVAYTTDLSEVNAILLALPPLP